MLPDVPAIDREFDYLLPEEARADVDVGTIVRVPLHGRRVRGWVVGLDVEPQAPPDRLLRVHAVVSAGPPAEVVDLCHWAAWRWSGPRAAFLRAASPPRVVPAGSAPETRVAVFPERAPPFAVPDGRRRVVRWPPALPRAEMVAALAAPEGSTIVVVPEGREARVLAGTLADVGRDAVILRGDQAPTERAAAWDEARRGACVVVGGRIAVFAPVPDLEAVLVLDDVDQALEEERAPSWHALDVSRQRAARAGARLDVVTPAPSPDAVATAVSITTPPRSLERDGWSRLVVVDLRSEAPTRGLLSDRLADELHRVLDEGGRALCVLNRRGRARLLVCRSCGELARCARCEAAVVEVVGGVECPRCQALAPRVCESCGAATLRPRRLGVTSVREHLAALVPRARVVAVDRASAPVPSFDVAIGTEALLHRAPHDPGRPVALVALLDLDQELLAPRHRAEEQALWLLVRASRRVGARRDRAGVVLVQTHVPDHPVVRAAADGDPGPLLEIDMARRQALGFPPFAGLAELSGDEAAVAAATAELARAGAPISVLGPTAGRALLRASSAEVLADALAAADLGAARALGRLRVDVDPRRV